MTLLPQSYYRILLSWTGSYGRFFWPNLGSLISPVRAGYSPKQGLYGFLGMFSRGLSIASPFFLHFLKHIGMFLSENLCTCCSIPSLSPSFHYLAVSHCLQFLIQISPTQSVIPRHSLSVHHFSLSL